MLAYSDSNYFSEIYDVHLIFDFSLFKIYQSIQYFNSRSKI